MKKTWDLQHNPFPSGGIARLGGNDDRENGLLFRPEVQQEKVTKLSRSSFSAPPTPD